MKKGIKYLLLAYASSSAGKGFKSKSQNYQKAVAKGYNLKDNYIRQAIACLRKDSRCIIRIQWDSDLEMDCIYFDVYGEQISFHTYQNMKKVVRVKSSLPLWNKKINGSKEFCQIMAKKFKLNYRP